jgi:hypothetical protein
LAECVHVDALHCCWRLKNNFRQERAGREAVHANGTDRVWNFDETKSNTSRETFVEQMRYVRWMVEIDSREGREVGQTSCREDNHFPTNTKSFG